jgi:hypothetical protein
MRPLRARPLLQPAAILAATAGLVLAGTSLAGAINGRALLLGRGNAETRTAALSNSRGTPLSLSAPKNRAPLAVNRKVMVKNLNAQDVGGLSASSLKVSGGTGFAAPNADIALAHDSYRVVAKTGRLPAGTYFVTATALIDLTVGDYQGQCALYDPGYVGGDIGGGDGSNFIQAAESMTIRVTSGTVLSENCDVDGTGDGSEVTSAGITAIRILSSSG